MVVETYTITLSTQGHADIHDITGEVAERLAQSGLQFKVSR